MSRYLVTGATGFLGRHLVAALKKRDHDVVVLVRRPSGDFPEGVVETEGDVLDRASLDRAFGSSKFDGVFHCAGKVSRKPEDAEELHKLHVTGTKNVLDAAIAANVQRAIVASTSGTIAVSDDPDHVSTEEDIPPIALLNRWPYYRSKLFAEKAALERHGAKLPNGESFEVVCVNPTLLLGPGDVNGSSTEDVRLFLERKIPAVPPGGLSYVDARDAADAMCLAMDRGVSGRRYLIGACNMTLQEFFARLERVSAVRAPLLPMPKAKQVRSLAVTGASLVEKLGNRFGIPMGVDPISVDMAQYYWYLDATLAETELGWTPRDPVETLADTVKDLQDRGVVWPDFGTNDSVLPALLRKATEVATEAAHRVQNLGSSEKDS